MHELCALDGRWPFRGDGDEGELVLLQHGAGQTAPEAGTRVDTDAVEAHLWIGRDAVAVYDDGAERLLGR